MEQNSAFRRLSAVGPLPRHVAVIMDGNGRWALRRGLPRTEGHQAGYPRVVEMLDTALDLGLDQISIYAFSTENWRRDLEEVECVLGAIRDMLLDYRGKWHGQGIRIRWCGRRDRLPERVAEVFRDCEELTLHNTTMTLMVCVDYGSRDELAAAATRLCREVLAGTLTPDEITDAALGERLFHADLPDVDLLIRTSGEKRLSNFLLWQSAYAELVFTDVLWPDFSRADLESAVEEYVTRNRRFGAVQEAA